MKGLGTFFFCTILLVSIAMAATGKADVLMFALTAISLCIFLSAYFVFPPTRNALSVRIPSAGEFRPDDSSEVREASTFLGRPLSLGDSALIVLELKTRYIYRLLGGFFVGLLLGWFLHVIKSPNQGMLDIVMVELFTMVCVLRVMKPCLEFLMERHLLQDCSSTLAANYSLRETSFYSKAWYSFVDEQDAFRGGTCRFFPSAWKQGELAIVFYDKTNSGRSLPNFGLHYHFLLWPAASVEPSAELAS